MNKNTKTKKPQAKVAKGKTTKKKTSATKVKELLDSSIKQVAKRRAASTAVVAMVKERNLKLRKEELRW